MAITNDGNVQIFEAGADLSAKQYFIVKLNSDLEVILADDAADVMVGVLQNAPEEGESAEVRVINANGIGKVEVGGTTAINDKLTTNSSGEAITTTTTTDRVIGICLEVGADGEVISYLAVNEEVT